MLIEHRHFDTTKYDHNGKGSTWTIKVKHTYAVYQDKTNIHVRDSEAFGQLESTISKLTDKNTLMRDSVVKKTINGANSTKEGPFIAGIQVDAAATLPDEDISEETEVHNDDPLYEATKGRRNQTRDETGNKSNEQHKAGEGRKIMDRYPRSRSILHDVTQHENYRKGYRFYYGVSSLTTCRYSASAIHTQDGKLYDVCSCTPDCLLSHSWLQSLSKIESVLLVYYSVYNGMYLPQFRRHHVLPKGT
jgi:hypothetical protein